MRILEGRGSTRACTGRRKGVRGGGGRGWPQGAQSGRVVASDHGSTWGEDISACILFSCAGKPHRTPLVSWHTVSLLLYFALDPGIAVQHVASCCVAHVCLPLCDSACVFPAPPHHVELPWRPLEREREREREQDREREVHVYFAWVQSTANVCKGLYCGSASTKTCSS